MDLDGKIAVVTGASSGFGRLIALKLGARGAYVVLVARTESKLIEVAGEITRAGGDAEVLPLDVADGEAVESACDTLLEKHDRIDILVNNAGYGLYMAAEKCSIEESRRMMDVNYFGPITFIKKLLPHFYRRGEGHIINVASSIALGPLPSMTDYSASKCALAGFTDALWGEARRYGVRVSIVNPGPSKTGFFDNDSFGDMPDFSPFMTPPERIADKVLRLIETGGFSAIVPWFMAILLWFRALVPCIGRRTTAWMAPPKDPKYLTLPKETKSADSPEKKT